MASKNQGGRSQGGKSRAAAERRARVAEAKAAAARAERRRRLALGGVLGGVAVLVLALVIGLVLVNPGKPAKGRAAGAPSWPGPTDVTAAVTAAGLPMLNDEGTVIHIHAHLDVLVNGKKVTVPQGIGIDTARGTISPLHTHDTSGVIHVESATQRTYTLGEFLAEWKVKTSATGIQNFTASGDKQFHTYVNGKPVGGDPAALTLHAHDEIALVYGTAAEQRKPPASYTFPDGE